MNKSELIDYIAGTTELTKATAGRALDALIEGVTVSLSKGDEVSLTGFGTFMPVARAERDGRNPRTGAAIKIKATKTSKFRPGKMLREALN
jgi:DNA-binding protein HU-beta